MKRAPFSQCIVANLIFREREPGEEAFDTVQWQMPNMLMRLFQDEARRRKIDVNSLIRDVVCEALTERAWAIRAANALDTPDDHHHG